MQQEQTQTKHSSCKSYKHLVLQKKLQNTDSYTTTRDIPFVKFQTHKTSALKCYLSYVLKLSYDERNPICGALDMGDST